MMIQGNYNGGFYSGDTNWGFRINHFGGNQYWTECRGHWSEGGLRGFRLFNNHNGSVPFYVQGDGLAVVNGSFVCGGNLSVNSSLYMAGDTWHHGQGRQVFYFESSGRNYYTGGSDIPHMWRRGNQINIMSITDQGTLRASGPFQNISDERIKKDIEDIDDTVGLEKILLVKPKTYKYIDEAKGTHTVIGFIAQQIHEIIPEAVDIATEPLNEGDEIEDFHYLNKAYIFTLNVCATQELHRMIIRQQALIDDLIARMSIIENK